MPTLSEFVGSEGGGVLILTALGLPVLLGFAGLAVDGGRYVLAEKRLAESVALACQTYYSEGPLQIDWAKDVLASNLAGFGLDDALSAITPTAKSVQISASVSLPTTLMGLFGFTDVTPRVEQTCAPTIVVVSEDFEGYDAPMNGFRWYGTGGAQNGWYLSNGSVFEIHSQGFLGSEAASSGTKWMEMDSHDMTDRLGFSRDVTLVRGYYELAYAYRMRPRESGHCLLGMDDYEDVASIYLEPTGQTPRSNRIDTAMGAVDWEHRIVPITIASNSAYRLTFYLENDPDHCGALIDDIVLRRVAAVAATETLIWSEGFESPMLGGSSQTQTSILNWQAPSGKPFEMHSGGAGGVPPTPYGAQVVEMASNVRDGGLKRSTYLTPGFYVLRYAYNRQAQVKNEPYDSRIGVFFDTVAWAAGRRVDSAQAPPAWNGVDAPAWQRRVVQLRVTTAGTYDLSFVGEGGDELYGGLIDDVSLSRIDPP